MNTDQLRTLWITVGTVGVLAGTAALGIIWWLHREAMRYQWAIDQVHRVGLALARMHASGQVTDMRLLAGIAVTMFLELASAAGAGVASVFGNNVVTLALLVTMELMALVALAVVVVMAFLKYQRSNKIRTTVRLNSEAR